jgi:hypothetical protein
MMDSELNIFCRQVRNRSLENQKAISLLHHEGLVGNTMGVLRQELDSMVRCIFLLSVSDKIYRERLLHDAVHGNVWRNKDGKGKVTDKDMVELSSKLHGWAKNVYSFGCSFIHLSAFHDYSDRDPFELLVPEDRCDIANYLHYYHCFVMDENTKLRDIEFLLPAVFEKISSNLECYVKDLEAGKDLKTECDIA